MMQLVIKGKAVEIPRYYNSDGYSLTETRIGTWIDGKPIYRMVVETTTPSVGNTDVELVSGLPLVESLIRFDSFFYASDGSSAPFAAVYNSGSQQTVRGIWYSPSGSVGTIRGQVYNKDSELNKPLVVILEYTKSTDTAS